MKLCVLKASVTNEQIGNQEHAGGAVHNLFPLLYATLHHP